MNHRFLEFHGSWNDHTFVARRFIPGDDNHAGLKALLNQPFNEFRVCSGSYARFLSPPDIWLYDDRLTFLDKSRQSARFL